MVAPLPKTHRHGRMAAALVLTLVGLFSAAIAFAGVILNTIDPDAVVTNNGRHIMVTGPLACTASETAALRVTVTQRATGAVAEGRTRLTCTGHPQHWEVEATSHGTEPFQAGPATAVAVVRTTTREESTDAHQWLVEITLKRK